MAASTARIASALHCTLLCVSKRLHYTLLCEQNASHLAVHGTTIKQLTNTHIILLLESLGSNVVSHTVHLGVLQLIHQVVVELL